MSGGSGERDGGTGAATKVIVAGSGRADGAAWAVALRRGGKVVWRDSGFEAGATPYRGDLLAVLAGVRAVQSGPATVVCANQNIILTATGWMQGWRARGWRKRKGAIEHLDLIRPLAESDDRLQLTWMRADPADPAFAEVKEHARSVLAARPLDEDAASARAERRANASALIEVADSPVRLVAYTDGGCRGNPGPGGWGFLLIDTTSGTALERRGGEASTTNNRMEMRAAIEVLAALKRPGQQLEIRTDSSYLINLASKWMIGWKRRGWQRKGAEPIKNLDLVRRLDELVGRHGVSWRKVPGHAGEPGNEFADRLTNEAMDDVQAGGDGAAQQRHAQSPVPVKRAAG